MLTGRLEMSEVDNDAAMALAVQMAVSELAAVLRTVAAPAYADMLQKVGKGLAEIEANPKDYHPMALAAQRKMAALLTYA